MEEDNNASLVCESCPLMGGGTIMNHGRINPVIL